MSGGRRCPASGSADACGGRIPADTRLGKALAGASRDGDVVAVRRLLDEGAMPDSGFASGYTALGLACNRGHTTVAEELLRRGASANLPICSDGATPLVISVVWNRRAAVDLLLRHGADIVPSSQRSAGPYKGADAIQVAREAERGELVAVLVRSRAQRRLARLRRAVPAAARFLLALKQILVEIRYRPGGAGAQAARVEFEEAAGGIGFSSDRGGVNFRRQQMGAPSLAPTDIRHVGGASF